MISDHELKPVTRARLILVELARAGSSNRNSQWSSDSLEQIKGGEERKWDKINGGAVMIINEEKSGVDVDEDWWRHIIFIIFVTSKEWIASTFHGL
jgi:hypothetical protein